MRTKRLLRAEKNRDIFLNDPQQKIKQQKIQKKTNLRFLVLFVLFLAFILVIVSQLYSVQIVQHEKYSQVAISQFDETRIELPTRGEITDSTGKVLVTNKQRLSFIYLPPKTETNESRMTKATRFVELFDADITTMTTRDKQDAYIFNYPEEVSKLNTQEELDQYAAGTLTDNDLYRAQLSRITPSLIENSLSDKQLKEFFIYSKMRSGLGLDVILKESITPEEINLLSENYIDFSGIEIRPNWDRVFVEDHHLQPIIGEITTSRQGLLKDNSVSMQALDYKLNDRVGRSGLEQTYEPLLAGIRTRYSLTYSDSGLVNLDEVSTGRKGDTLKLTIDTDYQKKIENMVSEFLLSKSKSFGHEFFNQMYVVVSDPNNGSVLATVGIFIDEDNEIVYSPNGTYLSAFLPGSSIKGSVVYLALDEEIFQPGELVLDEPIKIQGTDIKASSALLGEINDLEALAKSSNVYMFKTAMALGNAVYEYDKPLNIDPNAFAKIRANFSQFGLGIETGLDVPLEERGYQSNSLLPGHLLDYVIGQYDSYTAMQLNQYVSTIANGQYRYKMRLASESFNSETGLINYQNPVQILNALDNPNAISRVQQGFRLCVTDGYCRAFQDTLMPVAAKTGTAEDFFYHNDTMYQTTTNTLVAYMPYEKPQVAVSCIAPHYVNVESVDEFLPNGCEVVVEQILNDYAQKILPNQILEENQE